MKILHLGKYFLPFSGGIENVMLALMNEQRKIGHQVAAIVHQHDNNNLNEVEYFDGMTIYKLPIQFVVLFVPVSMLAFFRIRRILKIEQPNVLHLHMPNVTCFWLLLSSSANRIPWVVHWHSDVVGAKPDWRIKALYPIYRCFERAILKRASKIIVTSDNYLASSRPLSAYKSYCEVIPLGIPDLDETPAIALERKHSRFALLCLGRLTYYKGHRFLIDAMKELGNSVHLTIVGNGDKNAELRKQVSELQLEDCVSFVNSATNEEVRGYISNCNALVLPSIERTEAFGLVLLEAMRAGKPCICSDVEGSGMNEVVQHQTTGLVVEVANVNALKAAIEQLVNDPALCQRLGSEGRTSFLKSFEIKAVSRKVEALYLNVLQDS